MITVAVDVAVTILIELNPDCVIPTDWVEGHHGVGGALCSTLSPISIVLPLRVCYDNIIHKDIGPGTEPSITICNILCSETDLVDSSLGWRGGEDA